MNGIFTGIILAYDLKRLNRALVKCQNLTTRIEVFVGKRVLNCMDDIKICLRRVYIVSGVPLRALSS